VKPLVDVDIGAEEPFQIEMFESKNKMRPVADSPNLVSDEWFLM
jgi:hypothetical protein